MSEPRAPRRWHLAAAAFAAAVAAFSAVSGASNGDAPASDVQTVSSGTAHDAYFSLAFDGDTGIAVGGRGRVATTTDTGRTWAVQDKPAADVALLGVALHGGKRMAVGQSGTIVLGEGDAAWAKVASGTDQRLFAVDFNTAGVAAAAGAFGTILVSEDHGRTWKTVAPDWSAITEFGASPHLYDAIVADSGEITLVGEFGLVLRSADRGATWAVLHKGDASLFDIDLRPDGTGFAAGQDGTVLRTQDGGQTWSALETGSHAVLLGVSSTPAGRVIACGMRTVIVSDDGGATWREQQGGDFTMGWYQRVKAFDGKALLAGHAGRIVSIGGSRAAAAPDSNS